MRIIFKFIFLLLCFIIVLGNQAHSVDFSTNTLQLLNNDSKEVLYFVQAAQKSEITSQSKEGNSDFIGFDKISIKFDCNIAFDKQYASINNNIIHNISTNLLKEISIRAP